MALRPPPSVSSPSSSHPGVTGAQQRAGGVQCPARVAARSSPASFLGTGSRTRQDKAGRGVPRPAGDRAAAGWGVRRRFSCLRVLGRGDHPGSVLGEDLGDSWAVALEPRLPGSSPMFTCPGAVCCGLWGASLGPCSWLREQGQPGARAGGHLASEVQHGARRQRQAGHQPGRLRASARPVDSLVAPDPWCPQWGGSRAQQDPGRTRSPCGQGMLCRVEEPQRPGRPWARGHGAAADKGPWDVLCRSP